MATNIKKLLKKKGWTGEEVGKLLMASLVNDIKQQGSQEKKPLFSQSDFEKLESGLTTERDYMVYGVYRDLYSSIIDAYNRGQGLYQQFFNGYFRLFSQIREVQNSEKIQEIDDNSPLILTEKQYENLKKESENTLRSYKTNYYSIFFTLLEYFLRPDIEIPEKIKNALEAVKNEPAKNKSFSESYNDIMENGYYSLPDGRRSDEMDTEEWLKNARKSFELNYSKDNDGSLTYNEFMFNLLMKEYELFFKGAEEIKKYVLEKTGKKLDGTNLEIEEAIKDIIEEGYKSEQGDTIVNLIKEALGFSKGISWHTYTELPENLTAYDLLEAIADSANYAEINEKEHYKKFKKEYPEIFEAISSYIEEYLPTVKGIKTNQIYKELTTWGELADAGIPEYKNLVDPDDRRIIDICFNSEDTSENLSNKKRANFRGIAILKNPTSYQIDENGNYLKEKTNKNIVIYDLDINLQEQKKIRGFINDLIYPALQYLYSFNYLIKIICDNYDIKDMYDIIKFDTAFFEDKIEAINNLLYTSYYNVYGNEKEKQHKREIIKQIFSLLDYKSLIPTNSNIKIINNEIKNLGFSTNARRKYKYLDSYLNILSNIKSGDL